MQPVPRTQTAFRLKDSLLERLKWHAKRQHTSLNTLVEKTLENSFTEELVFPKLPPEFFEQAKELERFALTGVGTLTGYDNDKEILADVLYEEYIARD